MAQSAEDILQNLSAQRLSSNNNQAFKQHSFSSKHTNKPNKLECCITLGCKGYPETNTIAYWAHSKVTKKMK
jgi:hypothetical protein